MTNWMCRHRLIRGRKKEGICGLIDSRPRKEKRQLPVFSPFHILFTEGARGTFWPLPLFFRRKELSRVIHLGLKAKKEEREKRE